MSEKTELFKEIDEHICQDEKPSIYIESINMPTFTKEHPFTMLSGLKSVEQSPQHHPEGNVWNHTMMVLDEGAKVKDKASDRRMFMWAAILHDIGKAVTTKVRKGKITAYDHDKVGAKMALKFLSNFTTEEFAKSVAALVRWHMQILYISKSLHQEVKNRAEVKTARDAESYITLNKEVKPTYQKKIYVDIESMRNETNIKDVALLGLCDRLGRTGANRDEVERVIFNFIEKTKGNSI